MATTTVKFTRYPPGIYEILYSPVGPVQSDLHRRGLIWLAAARMRCPVGKTGKLRNGLSVDVGADGITGRSDQPYAEWVVKGTKPHTIVPRRAKVLAFEGSGGEMIFTRRAQHPGTAPNNFAHDALVIAMRG